MINKESRVHPTRLLELYGGLNVWLVMFVLAEKTST